MNITATVLCFVVGGGSVVCDFQSYRLHTGGIARAFSLGGRERPFIEGTCFLYHRER